MTSRESEHLARKNIRLHVALHSARRSNQQLREVNANLRIERDVTDALLAKAMDAALEGKKR